MKTQFIEKDQNWDAGSTTYWFNLTGTDYGTEIEFDNETYGIIESGCDDPVVVDSENRPMTAGDRRTIAVINSIRVTDEMRCE